jgi:hypothetical protein
MHEKLTCTYRTLPCKTTHNFLERIVSHSEQHQVSALDDGERVREFDTAQKRLSPNS